MARMHLTTEEVALASVAIGGLIGAFAAGLRDRSTQRRDHMVRLWEQETGIYEDLLVQVDEFRMMRDRVRAQYQGLSDFRLRPGDLDFLGDKSYQRLDVRLRMFAFPEVMAVWDRVESLLRECVVHLARFNATPYDQEADDAEGQLARLVQIKDDILANLDQAQEADDRLTEVIKIAVQRVPSARQLPRPPRIRKLRAPRPAQPG
jgi:hypothetical protein